MDMRIPVRSILLRYVNNRDKLDNNYHIAKFILEYFIEIPEMTIYELSEKCFVSTSAISRFIRQIGFQTYTEFRKACEENIDITNDYSKKFSHLPQQEFSLFVEEYTVNVQQNLSFILEHLDFEQLARINQYIHEATDIVVFGLEFASFLSQHLQIKLAEMNRLIQVGSTNERQMKIANEVSENSVALIFSMEGGYFYYSDKVLSLLKNKGTKIIVFTLNKTAMIERVSDEIVLCGTNNENTEGRNSILYLMEILIYQYMITYHK